MSLFVYSSAWYAAVDAETAATPRSRRPPVGIAPTRRGVDRAGRLSDLDIAWEIGAAFLDQDFSLVDRTCFAVMQRLGIHQAATFDDHFAVFRFGPRFSRAFEVIR